MSGAAKDQDRRDQFAFDRELLGFPASVQVGPEPTDKLSVDAILLSGDGPAQPVVSLECEASSSTWLLNPYHALKLAKEIKRAAEFALQNMPRPR